jgi:hypothetical protein
MVVTPEPSNRRAEQGFGMISIASKVRIMMGAVGETVEALRRRFRVKG